MSQSADKDKRPAVSPVHAREKPEPGEDDRPWSILVWIFLLTFVVWGTSYFVLFSGNGRLNGGDTRTDSPKTTVQTQAAPSADGAAVFQNVCLPCHQGEGQGLPGAFPPLAGSQWVMGSAEVPVKIVLAGLHGPIEVKGAIYNGVMPAFGAQLNDAEIAAVVSYVRASWGNNANAVKVSDVSAWRSKYADRKEPWTAGELTP